jgi:hypothetical protein
LLRALLVLVLLDGGVEAMDEEVEGHAVEPGGNDDVRLLTHVSYVESKNTYIVHTLFLVAATNSVCMGRTVLKYCASTLFRVRFRSVVSRSMRRASRTSSSVSTKTLMSMRFISSSFCVYKG